MTRVIKLNYRSARELAKLPQNKQAQACHLAQKLAEQDRQSFPTSRLIAKAVRKTRQASLCPTAGTPDWLKLSTLLRPRL